MKGDGGRGSLREVGETASGEVTMAREVDEAAAFRVSHL